MEFTSKAQDKLSQITDNQKVKFDFNYLETLRNDVATTYKPLTPVIRFGKSILGIAGDISCITGQPKAGKSTVTKYIIATALMETKQPNLDTLGIVSEYCQGREVIYIDTEQNEANTQKMTQSIMKIAGLESQPKNYIPYNFRKHNFKENQALLNLAFKKHPNAFLWIIDGVTDLLQSANDEAGSCELVSLLMSISAINHTCIVGIVHENKGAMSGNMRGHIGSELSRKSCGVVSIAFDRNKKFHTISGIIFRNSGVSDDVAFRYDENGDCYQLDPEMAKTLNEQISAENPKKKECIDCLEQIYKGLNGTGIALDNLKTQIMNHRFYGGNSNDKESIAKYLRRLRKDVLESGLLRIENEKVNMMEREVAYYESQNLEISFSEN